MGLNDTPSGDRVHIGFFGRRNAGKSSLVNAVTGQDMAVVSDTKGTTTDPVSKSMELLPLGPVVIIDTPGFDDDAGTLGQMRVQKARQMLNRADLAVLVADASAGLCGCDRELLKLFREKGIRYLIVWNKSDLVPGHPAPAKEEAYVSAKTGSGIPELKEKLAHLTPPEDLRLHLVGDLLQPRDIVVLVTPIDSAAPKGRLILPQQQMIRDILEADAISVVVRENGLTAALKSLGRKPAMVITDSQAFARVSAETPPDIPLTSFSILMARYKGLLLDAVRGVTAVSHLKDGDTVLISEGCTHHRQCDDIGSVKLPRWLKEFTGKNLKFRFSSGMGFPEDLSEYALVLHCGGCMLNPRELKYRMKCAKDQSIPMTNYGVAIAYMNGILERSLAVLPEIEKEYRRWEGNAEKPFH